MLGKMLILTIDGYLKGDYWMEEDVAGRNGNNIFSFSELCRCLNRDEKKLREKIATLNLISWQKLKRRYAASFSRSRDK